MNVMHKIITLFVALVCYQSSFAQHYSADLVGTEQLFLITRHDGVEYLGKILSDDSRELLIETENLGKIYILKADIQSITKIVNEKEIVNGEYQAEGPFTTRYTFTTNALSIKKGENYTLLNLYGPEVHFALSDQFSLGVMTTWIASPIILAGKYTVKTKHEKINFSLGTLMGTSGYLNNFRGYGGLHFANVTFGSRKNNVTLSGGYAYFQIGSNNTILEQGVAYDDQNYFSAEGFARLPNPITKGPIFSIAMIQKAGAKASFVFDSMIGVFSQLNYTISTTSVTPSIETGGFNMKHEVIHYTARTTALFVMPGMRFQRTEKSAFQVSLAGVSVFNWANAFTGGNNFSFPIPMCSWFFKF